MIRKFECRRTCRASLTANTHAGYGLFRDDGDVHVDLLERADHLDAIQRQVQHLPRHARRRRVDVEARVLTGDVGSFNQHKFGCLRNL